MSLRDPQQERQGADDIQLFRGEGRPPLPPDIKISKSGLEFVLNHCLAMDPGQRPIAKDLLLHPWILEEDRGWTFEKSKIGKAVARRAPKTIRTAT